MGCDIHPAIEFREAKGKPWQAVMQKNPNHGKWEGEEAMTASLDIWRDYNLFAILGNVRNGRGVAGIRTGGGYEPMSDNRGIPDDISPEAKGALSDEHSATWVTLREILFYDWQRVTTHEGVVDSTTFQRWDRMKEWQPRPDSHCGGVFGGRSKIVSNEEMRAAIERTDPELPYLNTRVEWQESYAEGGKKLWTDVLPQMLAFGKQVGYDNVRLVMDFDS